MWSRENFSDHFNETDQAVIEDSDGGALLGKLVQALFAERLGSCKVQLVTVTLVCGCSPKKKEVEFSVNQTCKYYLHRNIWHILSSVYRTLQHLLHKCLLLQEMHHWTFHRFVTHWPGRAKCALHDVIKGPISRILHFNTHFIIKQEDARSNGRNIGTKRHILLRVPCVVFGLVYGFILVKSNILKINTLINVYNCRTITVITVFLPLERFSIIIHR